jgi:speckle-type POZ protein
LRLYNVLRTGAQMREGSEGVVRLQDIRAPVFKLLLHFIYSDSLPDRDRRRAGASGGASGSAAALAAGSSRAHGRVMCIRI